MNQQWDILDRTICWGVIILGIILGFIRLIIEIIKRRHKKGKSGEDPVEAAIAARRAAIAVNTSSVDAASEPDQDMAVDVDSRGSVASGKVAAFCPNCGTPLINSDNFCTKCGTPKRDGIVEQAPLANSAGASSVPASPGQPSGKNGLAEKYFAQAYDYDQNSEYRKSLDACDKAIELAPDWSDAHNLRGVILENMGCLDEAISEYRAAIRLEPADEDARENLAFALKHSSKGRKRVKQGNPIEPFRGGKPTQRKNNLWIIPLTVLFAFLGVCAFFGYAFLKDTGRLTKPAAPGMLVAWNDICNYAETKTVVAIDGYFPVITLSVSSIGGQEYKIPFYKSPDELDKPGELDMLYVRIKISQGDFRGGTMSPNMIAEMPNGYTTYDFLVMAYDGTNLHVGDKARLSGKVIGDGECALIISYIEAK